MKDSATGAPARAERRPDNAADGTRDRAEISAEALELHGERAANSSPELPAARMRAVLDRMSSGYYDREDVQAAVLERIARDLGSFPR